MQSLDVVRRTYLTKLHEKRRRNIICYYSGWLQKPGIGGVEIDDNDKNALMATVHRLDRSQGLDLLLHTPGGEVAATESLVDYLKKMFGINIVAFIPQIAMSAETMIARACRNIMMGKQSSLGPIDPQFNGIPAQGALDEFERAAQEIKEAPEKIPLWQTIISCYHPTFLGECENAVKWAKEIVTHWLEEGMFNEYPDKNVRADKVVKALSKHDELKTHSRHLDRDICRSYGLDIWELETDNELQDLVLTVHHAYMHTFAQSTAIKIIENHLGVATVLHATIQPPHS